MPIPLTYSDVINKLASFLVIPVDNVSYVAAQPIIINDAEQRIYRELDLLCTITVDTSTVLTANNPLVEIPTGFVVVEDMNVVTPAGTTNPNLGTRNPLTRVSKEYLNFLYPNSTGAGVPQYFADITQWAFTLGPWPAAGYTLEIIGTQRPPPLSVTTPTTFLTTNLPDLFFTACMVIGCGMQKNFGPMGDQPESAVTWEGHYQKELASAAVEEFRKKGEAEGWSTKLPSPIATPPRT